MSTKNNAHNGKQSEATRMELFIALDYLLEKCPDDKHTSSTVELSEYAESKFNVFLDRRRVNSIFDTLVKLTKENPDILPYRVIQVPNKPRYYIEKCLFNKKEIKAIAKAISKDSSLSKTVAMQYAERFLDKVTDKDNKDATISEIKKRTHFDKHIGDSEMNVVDYFQDLCAAQKRFYFRLKRSIQMQDCTSNEARMMVNRDSAEGKFTAAFVYQVNEFDTKVDVCLHLPDLKAAIITKIDNIIMDTSFEPLEQLGKVQYNIETKDGSDIKQWLASYYKGETGLVRDITFKFFVGRENENLKKHKKTLKDFFDQPLEFTFQQREVKFPRANGGEEIVMATDAVTTIHCNFVAFKKWYWEKGGFENVVVLEPADFNNRLLEDYIELFQRRIAKYGISEEEKKRRAEELQKWFDEQLKVRIKDKLNKEKKVA